MSRSNEDVLNSNEDLSFSFSAIELVQLHWRNYGVSFITKVISGIRLNKIKYSAKQITEIFVNKKYNKIQNNCNTASKIEQRKMQQHYINFQSNQSIGINKWCPGEFIFVFNEYANLCGLHGIMEPVGLWICAFGSPWNSHKSVD